VTLAHPGLPARLQHRQVKVAACYIFYTCTLAQHSTMAGNGQCISEQKQRCISKSRRSRQALCWQMSSQTARVVARAIQPGDRDAWDKLFGAYREFYKLPHDPAARARGITHLYIHDCLLHGCPL
jgi:hypothetical protein